MSQMNKIEDHYPQFAKLPSSRGNRSCQLYIVVLDIYFGNE